MADPASNIPAYRQPGVLDRYNSERVPGGSFLRDAWDAGVNGIFGGNILNDQISRFNLNADETLALINQKSPESQNFLDVIAGNDRVKQAFYGAAKRDGDFLSDLKSLAASGSAAMSPEQMEKALQQPGAAEVMTQALDNVGKEVNGKKVGFEEIQKFADDSLKMAETLDPEFGKKSGMTPDQIKAEKEKRKKNFSSAMSGVGVDEGVVASAYGQKAGMDILKKMFSGDTRGAIQGVEDLMLQSGMDPEQAKALMKLVAPVIGLTSEFMKPYAEFADFYGPQFTSWAKQASGGKIDLANLSGETPRGDRTSASASGAVIKTANIDLGKTFTAEHDGAGNGYKKDVVVPTVATPRPDYGQPAFGTFG